MKRNQHIYCYPFTDVGNAYINKTIRLWQSMGYVVKACPDGLISDWRLSREHKTIVLNWYEDWMLRTKRPVWLSLSWALLLLGVFSLSSRNIIWIRHNYQSHDTQGRSIARRILVFFLTHAASSVVTHRPVADISSTIVPHPLVTHSLHVENAERDIDFLWFGMVREYKRLDMLLSEWPVEQKLMLLGESSNAALSERLLRIISQRQLKVEWQNRFIPDDELNECLRRTKFVVLAHDDKTIIVSGAFYHAIACGANVVIRQSEFGRFAANQHDYVHLVDMSVLSAAIQNLRHVPANNVLRDATAHYGDSACCAAWTEVIAARGN